MKFVYATDLHGDIKKYEDVLKFTLDHDIKLIHLGADILPKGYSLLKIQKKFVKGYLKTFYIRCSDEKITVLAFFGNDDVYTRKRYFRDYADLLDEIPYEKEGYEFRAYPYVLDYPFGLKTSCKLDHSGWICPDNYLGIPCDYNESGQFCIEDVKEYFSKKGTIEEDLKNIHADNKTIMAIHQPPHALNLDVCMGEKRVGSKSVLKWIEREQPLMVLSGHIHENFEVTSVWKAMVNNTLVIQPGQMEEQTTLVYIDICKDKIDAQLVLI